jgi:hypothetical protein
MPDVWLNNLFVDEAAASISIRDYHEVGASRQHAKRQAGRKTIGCFSGSVFFDDAGLAVEL